MGQLIRICLSVHRIWEVLSVRCLGHGRAHVVALATGGALDAVALRSNASHSVDCSVCTSNWLFAGAAMINSITVIIGAILHA